MAADAAARLYIPWTSSIARQCTILNCPLALRAYYDPIVLAVINLALAHNGVAALCDGQSCCTIGNDIAVLDRSASMLMNIDASLYPIMNATAANKWISTLNDIDARANAGHNIAIFDGTLSARPYQNAEL